jgi:hypothetical protein
VRKQGFQIRQSKFFKLNYFIKEYERSSYGHEENQEINFKIKNILGSPAPPPVKPIRPNQYCEMSS